MLRRFAYIVLAVAMAALVAVSCGEKAEPTDTTASLVTRSGSTDLDRTKGSVVLKVTASGDWTLTTSFPGSQSDWGSVEPASGTGSRADIRFKYEANDGEEDRQVTLTLKPAKGLAVTLTLWQTGKGKTETPGTPQTYGYGADVSKAGWLELPATVAGDGREVLTHDMNGGKYENQAKSGVRNWSCYWDYNEHVSIWVAYPLNNGLKGSGSRTNAWGLDPLLPSSMQPNLVNSSYGGGWTRGHQIPSADRLTYRANVSTFYGTNMTPQDYDFNAGIWADLENKVRSYAAASDTLYVVTGCVLDGSTQRSGSSSGFSVKIPSAYFKALLYKGSSTYATNGYMAAGYLLPHDTRISDGSFFSYLMSIDELEEKTGIDFFPNLISVVGKETADKIEANVSNFWK